MNSTEDKATMLVVEMQYDLLGYKSSFVYLKQINMLAASEDGSIFDSTYIYTAGGWYGCGDSLPSEDMPRDILAFINRNFEDGRLPKLVTADVNVLWSYLQQSAPCLSERLGGAANVSVYEYATGLPTQSLVFRDYEEGRSGEGRTVRDLFSVALFFKNDINWRLHSLPVQF